MPIDLADLLAAKTAAGCPGEASLKDGSILSLSLDSALSLQQMRL
jgi:hypothetical protein